MLLDGAQIGSLDNCVSVFFREIAGQFDFEIDSFNPFGNRVVLHVLEYRDILAGNISLLAKSQNIYSSTGAYRTQKQIERGWRTAISSSLTGLIGKMGESVKVRIDPFATGKVNFHFHVVFLFFSFRYARDQGHPENLISILSHRD